MGFHSKPVCKLQFDSVGVYVFSFPGVQSDSAATVVQTAGGVGVYVYEAHVARRMRPMYATLYSYPSRVSLINQDHSFQQTPLC
jgi:hypothetical protein